MMVATLTPFDANDRLDLAAVRAHTWFLVEDGVAGLCPAGTTGEMLYLSVGEKVRLIEETCAAAGTVPVVAGVWALRETEIQLLCRAAKAAGASAVFLPPPIYYPASDDAVYRHYAAAREAADLPVFAYNIPAYAANAVSLDCVERMVADGVIAGIKDSTGKADQMKALIERFGSRIAVEAASDSFALEAKKLGAHGFISALANIWPASFVRLWNGDEMLQPLVDEARSAVKKAGGIPALKYLLSKRGFSFGDSRLPHSALSADARSQLGVVFDRLAADGLN
jgi:4-hydroxy-tetrahydrodipicolinate synthase